MIRAYCYASGLIDFGRDIPAGATIIARGPEKELREFIEGEARRGSYGWRLGGRRRELPGSPSLLLVPGVPEADNPIAARQALQRWSRWIASKAPFGVRVLPS
jgi:hypothetical protein